MGGSSIPEFRFEMLERGRITRLIDRAAAAIVVLEGSLGTGKTAVAAEVARERSLADSRVLWVKVTPGDESPGALWRRIHTLFAADPQRPSAIPGSSDPAGETPAGGLRWYQQQLSQATEPSLLILDDLHIAASSELSESLLTFVGDNPRWQLLATTRAEIPSLTGIEARVRVPVQRLTADDLAFSEEEVGTLISLRTRHDAERRAPLSAAQVREHTAGWPLAVHAYIEEWRAGSTPEQLREGSEWIRRFVARELSEADAEARLVTCALALMREAAPTVLSQVLELPLPAVLEALTAPPIPYLTARTENRSEPWYSLPEAVRHAVLGFVEHDIPAEVTTRIYRRAATALGEHDHYAAIRVALLGEAWAELTQLLLTGPISGIVLDPRKIPDETWLRNIPLEVRKRYPVIWAYAAFQGYAYPEGRYAQILSELRAVAGPWLMSLAQQPGVEGTLVSSLRMIAARLSGDTAPSLSSAEQLTRNLERLTPDEAVRIAQKTPSIYLQQAITYVHAHRYVEAETALDRMQTSGLPTAPRETLQRLAVRALIAAVKGHTAEAAEHLADINQLTPSPAWHSSYTGVGYQLAAALTALEADRLSEAEQHLAPLRELWVRIELWPYLVIAKTLLTERTEGPAIALNYLEQELEVRRDHFPVSRGLLSEIDAVHRRLRFQTGLRGFATEPRYTSGIAGLYELMGRNQTTRALALVTRMLTKQWLLDTPRRHAELLLLQSHLAHTGGDRELAQTAAHLALTVTASNGLRLPYRVLSEDALEALRCYQPMLDPEAGAARPDAVPTPLSEAELRALAAVAEHGSTPKAANALFLSRHTIRNQLSTAYRKLGAHNFEDALRVARQANLLRSLE